MDHLLRLENLPRTIELVRAGDGAAELAYVDQCRLPGELAFVRTVARLPALQCVRMRARPGRARWSACTPTRRARWGRVRA